MKIRIKLFLLVFLLLGTQFCKAQRNRELLNSKSVFFEALGNGGFYSMNYDQVFYHYKRKAFTWRGGFSLAPYADKLSFSLLTELNYLYGRAPNFLEIGIGLTYWQAPHISDEINWTVHPRIGYRYQLPNGGLFFRIACTPIVPLESNLDKYFNLWAGVSIGYTFKQNKALKKTPLAVSRSY